MKKEVIASENESPWWLIDLDVSNFEFQIFGVVATLKKKSKQIFKIRHFQIDELQRTFKESISQKIFAFKLNFLTKYSSGIIEKQHFFDSISVSKEPKRRLSKLRKRRF